jgi:Transmembrane amino acid transporter protein
MQAAVKTIASPSALEMDANDPGDDGAVNNTYNIVVENQESTLPSPRILHKQASAPIEMSGIFGASSNMVNSIVGAGIIGIPYAFKQSGLIAGILLLLLVGYLTGMSLQYIHSLTFGRRTTSFSRYKKTFRS